LYLRQISSLFLALTQDEPVLRDIFISRVDLSSDGSICYVYFSSHLQKEAFKKALETLKLYKPSMRAALARESQTRYVPDLVFRYDEAHVKGARVEELLNKIKKETDTSPNEE